MIHGFFPGNHREAHCPVCPVFRRFAPGLATGLAALLIVLCGGCGAEDDAPKASHFEHDHEIAAHWPTDLADVAHKIRQRLDWIDTGDVPAMDQDDHPADDHGHHEDEHDDHDETFDPVPEIVDLVSWAPEIAADTNLSETDWLPLYRHSESLQTELRDATEQVISDNRAEIESLCELIEDASTKIPEHFPGIGANFP